MLRKGRTRVHYSPSLSFLWMIQTMLPTSIVYLYGWTLLCSTYIFITQINKKSTFTTNYFSNTNDMFCHNIVLTFYSIFDILILQTLSSYQNYILTKYMVIILIINLLYEYFYYLFTKCYWELVSAENLFKFIFIFIKPNFICLKNRQQEIKFKSIPTKWSANVSCLTTL